MLYNKKEKNSDFKPRKKNLFRKPLQKISLRFNRTFTYPACCAGALENISIIKQEKLVNRASKLGKYLGNKLKELEEYPIVGLIYGIGSIYGIEFAENKKTKKNLDKK